jgi:ABC-type transport system involved in resistance to organic solvents, ATPase component
MGMLFQMGVLFTDLLVFENVVFPMREYIDLLEFMIRDQLTSQLQNLYLYSNPRNI